MFKRILTTVLTGMLLVTLTGVAGAVKDQTEVIDYGNGWTVEISCEETLFMRSNTKIASKKATAKYNGSKVGVFTLNGKFSYNGSSALAINSSSSATTYSGWNADRSDWMSENTVYGECQFSKDGMDAPLLELEITCSRNGDIS